MADKQQYSSCLVGELLVGINVEVVQEVTTISELTPVPLAPPFVGGLLNLRGEIVTAIDLRRRLRVGGRPADQPPVNVILRTDDGCVSLLVDQIGDVLEVVDADVEPPPPSLPRQLKDVITGVCKLDGRLLLLLDADAALTVSNDEYTRLVEESDGEES